MDSCLALLAFTCLSIPLAWWYSGRRAARKAAGEAAPDRVPEDRSSGDLARVNAELRRANSELRDFAHIASHDLQEPLRMITSYLQLLERHYGEQLDPEAREFLSFAVDGATRMKSLIQDLLKFSQAGTAVASFRPVSAGLLLEQALSNLEVAIEESRAQISSDPLPIVVADSNLLVQVFQNLIGNAIKFHGDRPPSIHVSATEQDSSWVFAIRDNGIGIDQQHGPRIFQIFERLHGADQYPGTGVGLAIAQKVVERHGGSIWFESQVGSETTFYFSIPIQHSMAMAQTNSAG
jgi:light-regulated signal transduction histidine kinase (bacteriophytochrome)